MYYGVSDVTDIYLIIFGFINGVTKSELNSVFQFTSNFRDFVNKEFAGDFSSSTDHDWPRLIRFYSGSDKHSIELFELLFERFINLPD